MKVKICGITRKEDAVLAEKLGADLVGVVMAQGAKRNVSAVKAKEIFSAVSIPTVVVTTHTEPEVLGKIVEEAAPEFLQLHSDVHARVAEGLGCRVMKAIEIYGDKDYAEIVEKEKEHVDYFVLDKVKGSDGVADWDVCRKIVKGTSVPVFLAGGLAPENVKGGIKEVKPFGVDVSAGVEGKDGKKDPGKLKEFIEVAKLG